MLYNIWHLEKVPTKTRSVLIDSYSVKAQRYKDKKLHIVYMSATAPITLLSPWCSCCSPPMMMFDGAGDSRDYLGAVFIIVSISAAGGAGAGVPWDRHNHPYEHRTYRHMRHPRGG